MLSEFVQILKTGKMDIYTLLFLLVGYVVMIFVCLPVHEFAHAFAAYKLGDTTAKWHGRLTLNPLKHLDLFGTLMLMVFGIGYARPVPVNPYNFRNPKWGMALSALAGPLSNLLMAIASVGLYRVVILIADAAVTVETLSMWQTIVDWSGLVLIYAMASVNLSLAVFNLLPIPPLDGSRLFEAILPNSWSELMIRYERYIMIGLFVLMFTGVLDGPLAWLRHMLGYVVCGIFGMPNIF